MLLGEILTRSPTQAAVSSVPVSFPVSSTGSLSSAAAPSSEVFRLGAAGFAAQAGQAAPVLGFDAVEQLGMVACSSGECSLPGPSPDLAWPEPKRRKVNSSTL